MDRLAGGLVAVLVAGCIAAVPAPEAPATHDEEHARPGASSTHGGIAYTIPDAAATRIIEKDLRFDVPDNATRLAVYHNGTFTGSFHSDLYLSDPSGVTVADGLRHCDNPLEVSLMSSFSCRFVFHTVEDTREASLGAPMPGTWAGTIYWVLGDGYEVGTVQWTVQWTHAP